LNRKTLVCLIVITLIFSFSIPIVYGQCYTCSDAGEIVCNNCQGTGKIPASEPIEYCEYCRGLGVISPTITKKSGFAQLGDKTVYVSGTFENDQSIGVYAIVTAEVMSESTTFSSESENTYFPPNEEILVTVAVSDFPIADWDWISVFGNLETSIYISNSDSLDCPLCGGDGIITPLITCSICGGSGFSDCPDCNVNLVASGGEGVTIIGIFAIIGLVIGGIVLIKRNIISESSLRKMPPYELQNWIIQKLSSEASSVRDLRVGINGYTQNGDPIQIHQSDNIGKSEVYKFANELSKKKLKRGIIIAFSFKEDSVEGLISARQNFRIFIKTLTIRELINGSNLII
jgi:hypothetical protein